MTPVRPHAVAIPCFLEHRLLKPLAVGCALSVIGIVVWSIADRRRPAPESGPAAAHPVGLQVVDGDALGAGRAAFPASEAVLVSRVVGGSPAHRAGVRLGDGILAVNGQSVRSTAEFAAYLDQLGRGQLLKLTILRGGLIHYVLLPFDRPTGG